MKRDVWSKIRNAKTSLKFVYAELSMYENKLKDVVDPGVIDDLLRSSRDLYLKFEKYHNLFEDIK